MANTDSPSRKARRRARRFELGIPDLKIIGALRVLSCSNAQQLLRLLGYSPASLTYIQMRLKRLADAGYLERLYLPRPSRAGSAPLLYRLTRKSIPVLRAQGLELPYRLRPSEARAHGYLHLTHTLEVNDVLIAATILARETPGLELARLIHERELQTNPVNGHASQARRNRSSRTASSTSAMGQGSTVCCWSWIAAAMARQAGNARCAVWLVWPMAPTRSVSGRPR